MKKLKLIAAMSCIWASSHAMALEPLQLPVDIQTTASGINLLSKQQDADLLQTLTQLEKDNTLGGAVVIFDNIWNVLTENQQLAFTVITVTYFLVNNGLDVRYAYKNNESIDERKKRAVITNLCNGTPLAVGNIARSYQIGLARRDALAQGLPGIRLSDSAIFAMVAYSIALSATSKVCSEELSVTYPSGRKILSSADSESQMLGWIDSATNQQREWQRVAKDYYLYPSQRNKDAENKINAISAISASLADKFNSMRLKELEIETSMQDISQYEQEYKTCQAVLHTDPECSVRAVRLKVGNIVAATSQMGSFKILTQDAHSATKNLLERYLINTDFQSPDQNQISVNFELR